MKPTTRSTADQCAQGFLEIKTLLDELEEGHTKSTCISKFLGSVVDPNHAEDARVLYRDGYNLA